MSVALVLEAIAVAAALIAVAVGLTAKVRPPVARTTASCELLRMLSFVRWRRSGVLTCRPGAIGLTNGWSN
jgi:hypothetical protein